MVRTLAALAILSAVLPALAAPTYRLEPAKPVLGEPLTLTLTARPGTLDKIDLAPLSRDFEIHARTLGSDGREETLVLTLYPLHPGRIVLPELGLRGRPPAVMVAEQSDATPRVRFRVETAPETYHVRQPLRLTIEACDDGSLMWQRPQLATQEGLHLRPLNEEQLDVERDGERCTAHRWHWAVQPTAAGASVLPLPMLEANKFGQRLRYAPPQAKLEALPVPNWLPSDAAVGRPEVSVSATPRQWVLERPLAWRIEVRGGYGAEALNNLLRLQLAGLPQFSDYPPEVEEVRSDSGMPLHVIRLYAVFRERGENRLPDLILPWYDPASGSMQQLQLQGASLDIVDPARQRIMAWLSGLAVLMAALALGNLLWRMLAWRLRRHRALAALNRVTDLAGLVRQLCAFSLRPKAPPAATLGEWRQRMQQETETRGLDELVAGVGKARYGQTNTELRSLLDAAAACLARARPRKSRPRA